MIFDELIKFAEYNKIGGEEFLADFFGCDADDIPLIELENGDYVAEFFRNEFLQDEIVNVAKQIINIEKEYFSDNSCFVLSSDNLVAFYALYVIKTIKGKCPFFTVADFDGECRNLEKIFGNSIIIEKSCEEEGMDILSEFYDEYDYPLNVKLASSYAVFDKTDSLTAAVIIVGSSPVEHSCEIMYAITGKRYRDKNKAEKDFIEYTAFE